MLSNLYYIDTNILIKYYRMEDGTNQVRDLIQSYGVKKPMGMKNGDALQIVAYEEFLKLQPDAIFVTHDSPLKNVLDELKLNFIDPVSVKDSRDLENKSQG